VDTCYFIKTFQHKNVHLPWLDEGDPRLLSFVFPFKKLVQKAILKLEKIQSNKFLNQYRGKSSIENFLVQASGRE